MMTERPLTALLPKPARTVPKVIPGRGEGAYELKFLLPDSIVEPVMSWAREHIPADTHAGPDGTYWIHSLYLDTEGMDVYHRARGFRESKYRIRRYGDESLVYLEKKSKTRGWVRKQRTPVAEEDLALLAHPEVEPTWSGFWFRDRLQELALVPQCQVLYQRLARVGEVAGSPIRLTLDRNLRCCPAETLGLPAFEEERAVTLEGTVLELKFRTAMPSLFKQLVREFGLQPASSSKYRRSAELCGLAELARS